MPLKDMPYSTPLVRLRYPPTTMRIPGWVLTALLLAGCDTADTAPSVQPTATEIEVEPPPGPPAALRRDLRTCERTYPGAVGEVEYGVRVAPAGNVILAKGLRTTVSPALLNCSLQRLRGWTFPPSAEGSAFRFSMLYGSAEEGASPVGGDKKAVKATIRSEMPALKQCYDATLRENPDATGVVAYAVMVAVTGAVASVNAEPRPSARLPDTFVECTLEKIRGWKFPMDGATEGADVTFTVVFTGSPSVRNVEKSGIRGFQAPAGPTVSVFLSSAAS